MQKSRRHPAHIYLPPSLVVSVKGRAKQLDLPLSSYFKILLRNFVYAGSPRTIELPAEKPSAQVRERLPFSVSPQLWADAEMAAGRIGGTVSLLVQALATAELLSPSPDFTICARGPKPRIQQ